ncbi:MAG TPA: hypothetical protein VMS73_09190 [Anaerolineaceae bacterium]|nr:hypothetical protein [Anaerolineaceae bacterium]
MTINQQLIICSNCKTPNPAKNLYCQSCGRALIPAAPLSGPAEVTQPMIGQPGVHSPSDPNVVQPYSVAPTQPYIPATDQSYAPPPMASAAPINPAQPPNYGSQGYPQPSATPGYTGTTVQQTAPPASTGGTSQPGYSGNSGAAGGINILQKAQAESNSFFNRLRMGTFSARMDTWNELIEGGGEKAEEVERNFVELFNKRQVTYVDLQQVEVTSGLLQRSYQVARHRSGSVSVFANPAGIDLMAGWEMSILQKPNWKMMGYLVLAAIVISFLTNLPYGWLFGHFLVEWILGVFSWILPVIAVGLVAGKIIKGDIWYMFIEKPDPAGEQEIRALAKAAAQTLQEAIKRAGLKKVADR